MRITTLAILFLFLAGCSGPDLAPARSVEGYGSATTRTVDAEGNVTETVTPPTPSEEALASWVKYGGIMAGVGILSMLPVFGGNIRTGVVIAAGGAGMAAVGHFIGSVEVSLPVWFLPALLSLVAVGMLYGWHVHEKQSKQISKTVLSN